MKNVLCIVAMLFVSEFFLAYARGDAVATLYGTVKDAKGQPLQGAEVRIQGSDPSKIGKVHTDAKGRYSYPGLETGTYRVILIVGGEVKASIDNVRTKAGEVETLNFDFQGNRSAKPFTKGKHYVWVPPYTGSHLGTWIEVDDNAKAISSGMAERLSNQGSALVRQIQANSDGPAIKAAGGPTGH